VQVAFKCLTTPLLLPINDGALQPVKIVLPPGRVVSATKPASLRAWMTIPMTVVDTIFKALANACPERVIAGHHCDLSSAYAYGFIDPSGRIYLARSGNVGSGNGGGWGAKLGEDGMPATVCINDGDTHNRPVEALEAKAAAVIVRRELWQDSGGAGTWRGGLGLRSEIRVLNPAMYQSRIERTKCAPWGLLGGKDGLANRVGVIRTGGDVERFPTGKVNPLRLEKGEGFITEMGGGGGFGDPLERDPERVLADVRSGYVSLEAARRDYGVIIQQRGRRFELDLQATAELRQQKATGEPLPSERRFT
jgi:N-methylhydantoinase B